MIEIVTAVQNRIKARRAAVFLDTCYSGAALKGEKGLFVRKSGSVSNNTLNRFREGVGRVVISASQADEQSWESDKLQNGYFTYYLIQGLKEKAGNVPIEQLYDYLKSEVPKRVRADMQKSQTPAMKRSDQPVEINIGVDTEARQQSGGPIAWLGTSAAGVCSINCRSIASCLIPAVSAFLRTDCANYHLRSRLEDQVFVAFDVNAPDARGAAKDQADHGAFAAAYDAADNGARCSANTAANL